jgi:hypothetical protein
MKGARADSRQTVVIVRCRDGLCIKESCRSSRDSLRHSPSFVPAPFRVAIAACALAALSACASKPGAPSAGPAAAAAPATPSWLTCPDPTDGPSIVANDISEAYRAWTSNSSTQLPPACVFTALGRVRNSVTDSTIGRALTLVAELRRRGSEPRDLLAGEVVLLARGRRFAEVLRAYERLVAVDSQPSSDVLHVTMAAARQRGDTALLVRVLSRAIARPDASAAMRTEYNVIRQANQLWAAINEARGLVRQNPRYFAAYPSLVGNFGTLGLADSVIATSRRALAAGAARNTILPSIETLVGAMLRHATLYGSTYGWDPVIATAMRVDSAFSAPSTKFMTVALIVYAAEARSTEIGAMVSAPATDAAAAQQRATGCGRIPSVSSSLDLAERRLREGGDQHAGAGQVRSGLSAARQRLTSLSEICSRAQP